MPANISRFLLPQTDWLRRRFSARQKPFENRFPLSSLKLNGVHHSARPTWKLRETVEFYRDKLGLPLIHAISAHGWGPRAHPDFLHFFFQSGQGSTIAFFYYIGATQPEYTRPVDDYRFEATHTAWQVRSLAELAAWRERIESQGIPIVFQVRHELIESIYFRDPNGYYLEITCPLRVMNALDAQDAEHTLAAAMAVEGRQREGVAFTAIDQVWREKARRLKTAASGSEVVLIVLDVAEFATLIAATRQMPNCTVRAPQNGYWRIRATPPLNLDRHALGLNPALWNTLLSGGLQGVITRYDRQRLEIIEETTT